MDAKTERRKILLESVQKKVSLLTKDELEAKIQKIEDNLFNLANFKEASNVLIYSDRNESHVDLTNIIKKSLDFGKNIALPVFDKKNIQIFKSNNVDFLFTRNNISYGKEIPIDIIDIAVIPGFVFDSKGGRISFEQKKYNKLISELPITSRKIAIAFQEQIVSAVPMGSDGKFIDIIITDEKIIYKI